MRRLGWVLALGAVLLLTAVAGRSPAQPPPAHDGLAAKALAQGRVRVIVSLAAPTLPAARLLNAAERSAHRARLASLRGAVRNALGTGPHRVLREGTLVPFLALELDAQGVALVRSLAGVVAGVVEDELMAPALAQSRLVVEADRADAAGFDGGGTVVALLDTGVAKTHPFLAGKVVREACFSSTTFPTLSVCPGGVEFSDSAGSGAPCTNSSECRHGTHVAGIAAGGTGAAGSGIAPGARLWAIQVFSRIDDPFVCAPLASCVRFWHSDLIAALDYVSANRLLVAPDVLAAVNLSLGTTDAYSSPCDVLSPGVPNPTKAAIDQLRAAGVATVAAAGNARWSDALSSPACISSAISVGSTGDAGTILDHVSTFSNVAPFLSLFAPGEAITSSIPGGGFATLVGTSMATPHVSGALAVLRQAAPGATVDELLAVLQATGSPITDTRLPICMGACSPATRPRIRLLAALEAMDLVHPDVAVVSATGPAVVTPGVAFNVTHAVRNTSVLPTGPFQLAFYLSDDAGWDAGDTLFATRDMPAGVAAGATLAQTTTVTVPVGVAHVHRILVRAENVGSETNLANNVASTAAAVVGPDLVVTAVTGPAKAAHGAVVSVSATVQNVGAATTVPSTLAYYLSTDATLDAGDVRLAATRTVPPLGAGTTVVTLPAAGALPAGRYFLIAQADDGNAIAEAREDNNSRAAATALALGPDVGVTAATGPTGAAPGLAVSVAHTVVNKGTQAVTGVVVGFYLSADGTLDGGDVRLGERVITTLGAGASAAATTGLTLPAATAPGVYRILVRADDGGALAEVDETDNVRATGPINVVRPDLRISALSPPAAVVAGRRVSVPHTVRNDSAAPGAAGPFGVELYLSADGTITPGADVLLAARTLAGLAPLAASAATPTVTIPDTPGELFLGAIADPAGAVTEDEENDNVLVAPIAIVPEMLRTTPASTFNSTMDAVVTGCAFTPNHSLDDQPSALRITAQSATTPTRWSGTLQFLDPFADPLGPVSVSIAMSGTVATTGAISGTFTIAAGTARGSGTFTGSATSSAGGAGTFTATFDGGFTFPAFCTISGTATQP